MKESKEMKRGNVMNEGKAMKRGHVMRRAAAISAVFAFTLSLSAGDTRALQEQNQLQDMVLEVVAEDELAPVRAMREEIRSRLERPMRSVDLHMIMEGRDFAGTSPSAVRWDSDGSRLWFGWKRWNEEESGTFEYELASGALRRLSEDEADEVPAVGAVWDREHGKAVWAVNDMVKLYDGATKQTRALLHGVRRARPTGFSRDGDTVVLRYTNNLFALPLSPGDVEPLLRQLTDIRDGQAPPTEPSNDYQRWLEAQQLALFDVLQRANERNDRRRERAEQARPRPLYLDGWETGGLSADPTLSWVAVSQLQRAGDAKVANVPNYVTASGFTEDIRTRIKVGDSQSKQRIGILEVATGRIGWADFGLEDRAVTVSDPRWSPDGLRALVYVRAVDNKDRWFAVLTPQPTPELLGTEGEEGGGAANDDAGGGLVVDVNLVATDHDEAWINWSVARGWGWMPSGEAIYFVSERDGSMHLYTVSASGGAAMPLTRGDFVVYGPRLTPDRSAFVFGASIPSPFEVQAYRLPLDGGKPQPITDGMGRMNVTLSPDGNWLAGVGSDSNRPWELYVRRLAGSGGGNLGAGTQVTDSPSPAFKSYEWVEPEVIHFTASDGTPVPARIYQPANPHSERPAVVFVHGAGYLHNVHRWWSSYFREYMFHHLLLERGYTVLDIDYRGSAGYGRDWRTAIYRHMGGKDLSDQVDGARYLVEEHGIDPERIGIYGGSYGGFITLMAMFTAPDSFAAGASLRPVTDWAAYNHPYTSNILNTPVEDPEAYWRSSPIYLAEGLEGALLICHGLIDTNVHAQDAIRLAQRLIELRKDNWELALYPVENHGFREPSSWYDEYRRILELFETNLKD